MYRVTVTYGEPTDKAAFDQHYRDTHVPLVREIPGLVRFTISHAEPLGPDAELPWYMQAHLYFENGDAAVAGLQSEAGAAAAQDIPKFATGGAQLAGSDELVVFP